MVSVAEILQERRDMAPEFAHRCTINRRTQTSTDDYGEPVYGDYAPLATNVPCLLYEDTGQGERRTPERDTNESRDRLMLSSATDVTIGDTVSNVVNVMGETLAAGPLNLTKRRLYDSHVEFNLIGL